MFRVGPWGRDHLLMFDLGYFRYRLFACIVRNGGYFLTRLKGNADPTTSPRACSGRCWTSTSRGASRDGAAVGAFTATRSACAWWGC